MMKKLLYTLLGMSLIFAGTAFAVQISVPSAPSTGFFLVSTSTGNYIATTTDPAHFGSIFATSSSATSIFKGGLTVNGTLTTNITGGGTVCVQASNTGVLSSAGAGCGSGSGSGYPFTNPTEYGTTTAATTTPIWAQFGVFASSTSHFADVDFVHATTSFLAVTGLSSVPLYANSLGVVVGTTTWVNSLDGLTAQVQTFSVTNDTNVTASFGTSGTGNHSLNLNWQSLLAYGRGGTGTSTAPVGQLLYGGASSYQSVATGTITGTGGVTATANQAVIGSGLTIGCTVATASAAGCIAAADWQTFNNKIGTSSTISIPNLLYVTGTGATGAPTVSSVATSTISGAGGISVSANAYIIGSALTITGTGYPFSPITWFGTTTSATTTPLFAESGIFASSTSVIASTTFNNSGYVGHASSSPWGFLSINPNAIGSNPFFVIGSSTQTNFIIDNTGRVGIGTTSPFAALSIMAASTTGTWTPIAFAIGSTTGFGATTTVFSISNAGNVTAAGTLTVTGNATTSNLFGNFLTSNTATFGQTASTTFTSAGFLGVGSSTPWGLLSINPTATLGTAPQFVIGSTTQTNFIVNNAGLVGIGTTSPFAALSIMAASSTGQSSTVFAIGSTTGGGTATSTLFIISNSGLASTTQLRVSNLGVGSGNCLTTDATGLISTQSCSGGAAPFTWATTWGLINAATTSAIWAQNGINASSTSHIASTTFAASGNVGIGSSTPSALLSLFVASSTFTTTPTLLFAIGSSTAAFATSTLFSITNTGLASSTNLIVSGLGSAATSCVQASVTGQLSSTGAGCSTLTTYDAFTHPAITGATQASATTSLMLFSGHASSTQESATLAFFGGTATSTFTSTGWLGVGSSTPFAKLSVNAANGDTTPYPFSIGSTTSSGFSTLFAINNYGAITVNATSSATSTAIVYNWSNSPPLVEYRIGAAATTLTLVNATTTFNYGSTRKIGICSPNATPGAVTLVGAWGTYTQTNTANKCDYVGFMVIAGTSTPQSPVYQVQITGQVSTP